MNTIISIGEQKFLVSLMTPDQLLNAISKEYPGNDFCANLVEEGDRRYFTFTNPVEGSVPGWYGTPVGRTCYGYRYISKNTMEEYEKYASIVER